MTTSMTPMGDAERWLPDPSWPVPPRGWQLWAAAGPAARPQGALSDGLDVRARPEMPHTDGVLSEIDRFAAFEDASFTLPTRPSLLVDHPAGRLVRVDLLAESRSVRRAPHRAPAGMVRGFAALAVLLVISFLVGGVTGALVVIGVSTLLAASAALVSGHISLSLVGGQRGAGLFLGVAVVALMAASVMPRDRPARQDEVATTLLPVSSNRVPDTLPTHAAVTGRLVLAGGGRSGSAIGVGCRDRHVGAGRAFVGGRWGPDPLARCAHPGLRPGERSRDVEDRQAGQAGQVVQAGQGREAGEDAEDVEDVEAWAGVRAREDAEAREVVQDRQARKASASGGDLHRKDRGGAGRVASCPGCARSVRTCATVTPWVHL